MAPRGSSLSHFPRSSSPDLLGELTVDQAHRGYQVCTDDEGFKSVNPLYMAYMPGTDGNFNGASLWTGFKRGTRRRRL